jgi:hypothetical protein
MRKWVIAPLALLSSLLLPAFTFANTTARSAFDLEPGTRVLNPIQFRQLTIFPVVQTTREKADAQYLTLADGLKQKLVKVNELGGGGQVNRVRVRNLSDRPLLMLTGEIVLGGKQDRIIGKDTVLAPKEDTEVEVFCVERGRWRGGHEFAQSGGMAETKLRVRAGYRKDQGQVWAQVGGKNGALSAQNSTDTYRNLAVGEAGKKVTKPYRDYFEAELGKLQEKDQMIGLIAAVNGRISSVDVFAEPALFVQYRDRLLDSLYVSVADEPQLASPAPAPTDNQIKDFMKEADDATPELVEDKTGSSTEQRRSKGVLGTSVKSKNAPPKAKPIFKSYKYNL